MTWRKGNRLKLVPESQAEGETARIYREIKGALGIPQIDGTYQALAAYPNFLKLHWEVLRPIVHTQEFFSLGERMRADCYTRMHGYFEVPDLCTQVSNMEFSNGAREELTDTVELHNYCTPLLLLMMAAQFQAFDSPVGGEGPSTGPAEHPGFHQRSVVLVPEDKAPAVVHRCYEDIRRSFGLPFVPSFYLSIARWPDFLQLFWETLRPIVRSPVYEGCHYGSRETGFALVREFPQPVELNITQLSEAGMSDEDLGSIVRIVELFVGALSAIVLNVAAAKIGLEGGTRLSTAAPQAAPTTTKKESEQAA
jgi:hypothetical protein